jgi:LuxR family quorum-sensing system transcriptional regulator CciR
VSLATDTAEHHNGEALGTLQVLAIQFQLAYSQMARGQPETQAKFHLTERERECLAWTARGKSAWAISMILGVSEHTVNFHMKSAMKKMGTTNRVSAVVSAIQSGLIVP